MLVNGVRAEQGQRCSGGRADQVNRKKARQTASPPPRMPVWQRQLWEVGAALVPHQGVNVRNGQVHRTLAVGGGHQLQDLVGGPAAAAGKWGWPAHSVREPASRQHTRGGMADQRRLVEAREFSDSLLCRQREPTRRQPTGRSQAAVPGSQPDGWWGEQLACECGGRKSACCRV